MSGALRILTPGPCTTVQDLGRFDAYHLGVPVSGMLDNYAGQIANWLVGNPTSCAILEMTLNGADIEFLSPADIAITGAAMHPELNGRPCRQWTSIRVQPGDVLHLGPAANGCRAYLAITGGIEVPLVLESRSTYLGGHLGGLDGRILAAGDILHRGPGPLLPTTKDLPWFPIYPEDILVRTIAGPHDDSFKTHLERFFNTSFTVTARCDRMGVRLEGPEIFRDNDAPESIISQPVVPGNVQIPPDGRPIILLNEQTIGGYTTIATVVSADIWRIGQAKPGNTIRFVQLSLEEGHLLYRQWAGFLAATKTLLEGR